MKANIKFYVSKAVVKDERVSEVMLLKNFTLKELSEMFHDIDGTKYKILEADSNLERSMTVCQGRDKMHTPCYKSYNVKKASTFQTT